MSVNEIVEQTLKPSTEVKTELKENEYILTSLWTVFFARLFDLFLASIPFLILGLFLSKNAQEGNWLGLFINFLIALILNFSYFVLFPYFLKGRTIGKIIFKIKLVKKNINDKITFLNIFTREMWFIIGPLIFMFLGNVLFLLFMSKYNSTKQQVYINIGYTIYQLTYLLFFIWIAGVMLGIFMQNNHQSIVDLKAKILVVYSKPKKYESKEIQKSNNYLKETPGEFSKDILDEIGNSEEKEFNNSISVKKPDFVNNLKIESKKKKEIEHKEGKSNE